MDPRTVDVAVIVVANGFNLLMAGVFLARAAGRGRTEAILGVMVVGLAVPLAGGAFLNASQAREWWTVALLLPLIAFCVVELVLDFVLKLSFRATWIVRPYVVLYYLAVLALIGYGFAVGSIFGFVTLATYFVALGSSWYAHKHTRTLEKRSQRIE